MLKLAKLPDRIPVRIAITVSPDLNRGLIAYAEAYRQAYGSAESVADLIPFMLTTFLESDRAFVKTLKENPPAPPPSEELKPPRGRPRKQADTPSSPIVNLGESTP